MRQRDLPVLVLQNIRIGPLQHARRAAIEPHRMVAQTRAAPAGLNADQPDLLVGNELVKRADGVRPPPTQAMTAVGSRPSLSRICCFISMLIMRWKSRTMVG